MRHLGLWGLAAALGVATQASAQGTGRAHVRGVVVGAQGQAVIGALVVRLSVLDSVRTSEAGEFAFSNGRHGADTLRVLAQGFAPAVLPIQVHSDTGWNGRIVLHQMAQALPQVSVSANRPEHFWKYDDFYRRQALGFGTFRTRDDFEKMGASDIVSALRSISGVSISSTGNPYGETEIRWRINRCPGQPPNIAIYVNGLKVAWSGAHSNGGSELSGFFRGRPSGSTCEGCARMGDLFSSLPLMDIEFIEFYRGPAQIPSDLDRGDACAALVIWTR